MEKSFGLLESGADINIFVAMSCKPKIDVLHLYVLIAGEVILRMNVAGYDEGDKRKCWDGSMREPKYWAVCTAPLSRPPYPIKMRGFQGFRYTEGLWV